MSEELYPPPPPYSTAYGIGMIHGARSALLIIDTRPDDLALYASGDKLMPRNDLQGYRMLDGTRYRHTDLCRDMGRQLSCEDITELFRIEDEWLLKTVDAYSGGFFDAVDSMIRAAHAVQMVG